MRFEFRHESLKSISVLILLVYNLMFGSPKNNRENYLSANRPSNNWALIDRRSNIYILIAIVYLAKGREDVNAILTC